MGRGIEPERTIQVTVDTASGATNRYFNVDNIVFLEVTYNNATRLAVWLTFGVPIVTFLLLNQLSFVLAAVVSVILFLGMFNTISLANEAGIGTITGVHEMEGDVGGVESEFLETVEEVITIEGEQHSRYYEYTYRFHIVPDNVVSIDHTHVDPFPLPFGFGVAGVVVFLALTSADLIVFGLLIGGVFVLMAVWAEPIPEPDDVSIEFGTGEEASFRMSSDNAEAFVTEFQNRRGGQSRIGGDIEGPDPLAEHLE